MIDGVKFGTGGGDLRFVPLVVRSGEESFETGPIFLLYIEMFPGFTVINKDTGLINELEVDANYLFKDVGSVTDGGEKGFHRLVNIVRGVKDSVVFLNICGGNVGVGGVQVIQDGAGDGEAVSVVLVSEGADERF